MKSLHLLENKVAIVTGASKGIGKSIAITLAENGSKVVINGRDITSLEGVKADINKNGGQCIVISGDVSKPETAELVLNETIKNYGKIDILVNNAGVNMRSSTLEMSLNEWKTVLDMNLNSSLYFCKQTLPYMIKENYGKIINVSSTASKTPHRNAAPSYGASKAALNYLTMHLALEYADQNIYVNGVCPGPIETDMTKQWSEEYRERAISKIPLKKLGTPQNVADTVLFLASDLSDFITGETININGGAFMN